MIISTICSVYVCFPFILHPLRFELLEHWRTKDTQNFFSALLYFYNSMLRISAIPNLPQSKLHSTFTCITLVNANGWWDKGSVHASQVNCYQHGEKIFVMLRAVRTSPCLKALFTKMSPCAFALVLFNRLNGLEQSIKSKIITKFVWSIIFFGHVVPVYSS